MSLIPYQPREGREIVLRHRDAIVVRDTTSQRLEIRGITECPTCHRPFQRRSGSPDRSYDPAFEMNPEPYVDPGYFRMLRASADQGAANRPPSPIRRPLGPAPTGRGATPQPSVSDAEFISSAPSVSHAEGSRIRREAFSPNYFHSFFKEEEVLGKGGKGVVLLVRHEIDGCHLGHFACKRVPVGDDHAWLEKVLVEVELLAKLSHPNLVSYRHVWLEDMPPTPFGPSVACAFILQQYCNGGDLHQYVMRGVPREATKEELKAQMRRRSKGQAERPRELFGNPNQLSFEEIYTLFRDITSGVAYLHANGYIHRDLKPSNCLLHQEHGKMACLISDFGEVQAENVVRKSSGSTGTISYCAPEVLKVDASGHYGNFTTKSDVFSLGMILYFMCFGRLPYLHANAIQEELEDIDLLRAEIQAWEGFQDERRERPDLPSKLYTLLRQLLSLNPSERPNATDVLLAMRSEANSERRGEPSPGLTPRNAFSNFDAPGPSGGNSTLYGDPQKRNSRSRGAGRNDAAWSSSISRETSPRLNGVSDYQPEDEAGSQSMTLSRGREGYRAPFTEADSGQLSPQHPDLIARPLLMAPPRGRLAGVRHRAAETIVPLIPSGPSASQWISLVFFFVRMTSLAWPCWPYMPSTSVGIPLVLLIGIDLVGLTTRRPPTTNVFVPRTRETFGRRARTSLALLVLHGAVIWMGVRSNRMCAHPYPERWADLEVD